MVRLPRQCIGTFGKQFGPVARGKGRFLTVGRTKPYFWTERRFYAESAKGIDYALWRSTVTQIELDLRLKIAKTEASLSDAIVEIDSAKTAIKTLVTLTSLQVESTANALIAAMEARDHYTAGHGKRTAIMMELLGAELGLFSRYSLEAIRTGAILHDIGKVSVPDSILLKQGSLTPPEYEVIKTHPAIGFDILSLALKQEEILRIVRHHHERLDGSGYPDGLRGHEIPDYVKAFSVCDCYDAMTSTRSYRRAMPSRDAISTLTDDALCGKLDMSSVKALKRLWKNGVMDDIQSMRAAA